ncbi:MULTISPECIES: beta-ketoacyl-ACP synthase 3 [Streptomyces]|uniref:Beta-ketoacyl-ACP synthase 3 n=1 Tax=Streptomyces ramulosus TaxID=47762 RepID=A0ABW1FD42_9ACTN
MSVEWESRHAAVTGVAGYRPVNSISNSELIRSRDLDSSDDWVRRRTGIISRRLAGRDETLEVMGAHAALAAARRAGVDTADVDCVLVASMSHRDPEHSVARAVADRLPGTPRAAFDVNAACAGFCAALEMARCLIAGGTFDRVLVVGAERMSDIVDPGDRSTSPIFADGAGAALVTVADEPGIAAPAWGSDGSGAALLTCRADPDDEKEGWEPGFLRMQGPELYRWVMGHVPEVAGAAVRRAGITVADLGAFIPHQANDRMIKGLTTALRLPDTVAVSHDVAHTGNTSAASIPLAMTALLDERPHLSGELALLIGFGAGLSYAAQVIRLP